MPDYTDHGQLLSTHAASRYEKVDVSQGGDGKWHFIHRQDQEQSCGPACVRMLVQMMKGLRITEEYFSGLVAVAEMGQSPQNVRPLSDRASQYHDFGRVGTTGDFLIKALLSAKIPAREAPRSTSDWAAVWAKCTEKTPAIAAFNWKASGRYGYAEQGDVNRGGHYVVVAGPFKNDPTKILVLDPGYGVQQLNNRFPTRYRPRQGGGDGSRELARGELAVSPSEVGGWTEVFLTY